MIINELQKGRKQDAEKAVRCGKCAAMEGRLSA